MALNVYITVTAIPFIFGGTAYIMVSKDLLTGLLYLFCTSLAYCMFLILDHKNQINIIKESRPWSKD